MRTATLLLAITLSLLVAASPAPAAQQIVVSDKITPLDGTWILEPEKGWGGICGVPVSDELRLAVSPTEISIQAKVFSQGIQSQTPMPLGSIRLDGSQTTLSDGRTATAATDAGWLAVTMTRERGGGLANVMREVYILSGNREALTVWRTLNVEMADGSQGKIDCGNH